MIGSDAHSPPGLWPRPMLMRTGLFLLPFLVYAGSLGFGLLQIDDHLYYLYNPALHGGGWQGLIDLWRSTAMSDYAPVTQLTLWFDLRVAGSDSWWFARLDGLAWMGVSTLAIHALLLRLGADRRVALGITLIYAVHPVCAQSVLWLAERKNLVCLALSLWCIERYVAAVTTPNARGPALAAWILGILALLAKPHALAVPVILAAYELILGQGPWRTRTLRLVPPFLVATAFVVISLIFIREDLQRPHLGGGLAAAVLLDGGILLRYLGHTVLPTNLTLYYAVPEHPSLVSALLCWVVVALVIALTLLPSRSRRLVAFGWLFAGAALAPALNLAPQLVPMTDYYQQWAMPGLLLIGGLLIEQGLACLPEPRQARAGILVVAGLALFAVMLSLARVPEFATKERFAAAAVRKQPDSALNWSIETYCLTVRLDPKDRQRAGEAALRAFACPDADRIFYEERRFALIEAGVLLHQRGENAQADALLKQECPLLQADDALFAQAQISLRTGHAQQAVDVLAPCFPAVLQQAAAVIRSHCRDGSQLPDSVAPMVAGGEERSNDQLAVVISQQRLERLQWCLAVAYLQDGKTEDAEKAFDVAAVLVNRYPHSAPGRAVLARLYRQFGLPEAADRVAIGRTTP